MKKVRIQKRSKRLVALGAVIAASALLSAFQPASATDAFETAGAVGRIQHGDFDIRFVVMEHQGGQVCADITNVVTGEYHWGSCGSGFPVEVSDTLDSASGAGTSTWKVYSKNSARGSKSGVYPYKSGTITVDMTWAGTGELQTHLKPGQDSILDPDCWISWETYCSSYYRADQTRTSTAWGTITDSEWGTFVIQGATGYMVQHLANI